MYALKFRHAGLAAALAVVTPFSLPAQVSTPSADDAPMPSYAAIAELAIASPVIADVTIRSTIRIKGAEAAALPPGIARFYVEADVTGLVRGPGALPPRVGYLLDAPLDARGRTPRYNKERALLFARPVPGRGDQLQLVRPDAQRAWNPALDALVRRVTQEVVARDAPPVVTGVGNAFHVAGSLPGEGETQIFLTTEDRRPVSLSILRRPGEEPRWAVALSEIVDDAAAPPARDTLLWYRLACFLPSDLPAASTSSWGADDSIKAQEDYRFVIARLGACDRGTPPVSGGDGPA